eukprot:257279-Amphidinium_carterae.1
MKPATLSVDGDALTMQPPPPLGTKSFGLLVGDRVPPTKTTEGVSGHDLVLSSLQIVRKLAKAGPFQSMHADPLLKVSIVPRSNGAPRCTLTAFNTNPSVVLDLV